MALLDMEGCDWANSASIFLRGRYSYSTLTFNASTAPYQGGSVQLGATSSEVGLQKANDQSRVIVGALCRPSDYDAPFGSLLEIWRGSTLQCTLELGYGGQFILYQGSTTLITSGFTATPRVRVHTGKWCWIEVDVTIGNAGSCTVYVNGQQAAAWSGVDILPSGSTAAITDAVWVKGSHDLDIAASYMLDTTGLENNARLGPFDIETLRPDGDGNRNDFTPDSGLTNYTQVDETVTDDATSYVESTTVDDDELYTYGNITSDFDTIAAVQINSMSRKDSGGDRQIRHLVRSSTTEAESAAEGVSVDWAMMRTIHELDPNTSALWTPAGVNAAEFGFTIES